MVADQSIWLVEFPFVLGLSAVTGMAVLYLRWDIPRIRFLSRSRRPPFSLGWKAAMPLAIAIVLFTLEHWAWKRTLPWFGAVMVKAPYDDLASRVLGRCLIHFSAGILTYLLSDALCRRVFNSPFQRDLESVGPLDAERNPFVQLSESFSSNSNDGNPD